MYLRPEETAQSDCQLKNALQVYQHLAVPVFIQLCVIENRIAFAPKYRRKEVYGHLRKDIGEILRKLCIQKGVEIIEAEEVYAHALGNVYRMYRRFS